MTPAQWKDIVVGTAPSLAGLAGVVGAIAAWLSKMQEAQKQSRADLQADYDRQKVQLADARAELAGVNTELDKRNAAWAKWKVMPWEGFAEYDIFKTREKEAKEQKAAKEMAAKDAKP